MKKLLVLFGFFSFFLGHTQIQVPKEFNFNTAFVNAENRLVILPPKATDKFLNVGLPYFDENAGYTFKLFGTLVPENGKLVYKPAETNIIARWQNLGLQVAALSDQQVTEFKLPETASFLQHYKSKRPENDVLVDKYSFMNGGGASALALKGLEKLKESGFKSEKFYFELAYAYNALGKFAQGEETVTEATKNGVSNELFIKEKHYALLNQNKLSEAADYLTANFKHFKTATYKSESIINQISKFYNAPDFENAEKWIDIYKKEIGQDQYKVHVDKFEKALAVQKK